MKPLKSILKQSTNPPPLTPDELETKISYFSPHEPGSFSRMLQSVIQQLAGQSVSSRLDAYMALNGALKAYESVPDPDAMAAKMGLLMQFISRDIVWRNSSDSLDVNILTQALKLVLAILFNQKLSAALDDDFRTFLMDRSISVIEQKDMPKAVVKSHLVLLAYQRFRPSIVTQGRAERIIYALQTIEDRCSGNNVVATRLVIYQRLMEQATGTMLHKMKDWLEPVIHCMLSSVKDVRIRAIEMCTLAGLRLGTHPHASKALLEMFQAEVEDGQSYCDFLILRLMQMIADKDLGADAPHIWSAIILFFRNKRYTLEKWPNFKAWLQILQKCLNSSNLEIRHQGHLAWNKLVFAIQPDATVGRVAFEMLKVPPMSGMERKGSDQQSKFIRQYALESYYNLLHYALKPGLSYEELDTAWESFVHPVLTDMIKANDKRRYIACRILHGLCTASQGMWNMDAAFEAAPIRSEELPRLEPRWVRSRMAKILKLMEPLLASGMWTPLEKSTAMSVTWHALMQSLADAGSQEVKTSSELKEAIALLTELFQRLWTNCAEPNADADATNFLERFAALVATAVQCVGVGPFTEDFLLRTKDNGIQPALTPSHRVSKHQSPPRSPLVLTFGLFYEPPSIVKDIPKIAEIASTTLQLLTSSRSTTAACMDLLRRSVQIWFSVNAPGASQHIASALWKCIAESTVALLESTHTSSNEQDSQTLGLELRNACIILANGVKFASDSKACFAAALQLFQAMMSHAKTEAGNNGALLAVVEPTARLVVEADPSLPYEARLQLATEIFSKAAWPRSRLDVDQARKALWGVGLAPYKSASIDAFHYLYRLAVDVMTQSYDALEELDGGVGESVAAFVRSLMSLLKACPISLIAVALRNTQDGLAVWISDKARKTSVDDSVQEMVCSSWVEVVALLEKLPHKDSTLLQALDKLLTAGFSSPHRAVVNKAIEFWNDTFGCQKSLVYPPDLRKILHARSFEAELSLPGFPDGQDDSGSVELPAFFESQPAMATWPNFPIPSKTPIRPSSRMASASPAKAEMPASSPAKTTSSSRHRKASAKKARLRHDDSQIQFAPIESSPIRFEESQMLTERQREVKARQNDDAQMFPALSSSPVTKPFVAAKKFQGRLDFTSELAEQSLPVGTPTGLPEAGAPMSDGILSSPTPSSSKGVEPAPIETHESDAETTQDPPSSPPRMDKDAGPIDKEVDSDPRDETAFEKAPIHRDSDLPSDTILPNEQLLREQAEVVEDEEEEKEDEEQEEQVETDPDQTIGTTFVAPSPVKQPPQPAPAPEVVEVASQEDATQENVSPEDVTEVGMTVVEDSFVQLPPAEDNKEIHDSPAGSQQDQPNGSSKKRKRSTSKGFSYKKRKSQSPLKDAVTNFFSRFRRSQPEEDDEDIEDEIVVASSQPSESPNDKEKLLKPRSPIVEVPVRASDRTDVLTQDEATSAEAEVSGGSQQKKRGRRRPRKSQTSKTSSPAASPLAQRPERQGKSLKRKSSALSEASAAEDELKTSVFEGTRAGAASKTTKQRQGPDAKLVQQAQSSPEQAELPRPTRRRSRQASQEDAAAVGTAEAPVSGDARQNEDSILEEHANSQQQSADEHYGAAPTTPNAAVSERQIATPKSIMGRLRDALSDLSKTFLGAQEEREMDDMLYEIRREVHEAGRRGRDMEG